MEHRESESLAAEMRWLRQLAAELAGDASAAEDLAHDAWMTLARREGPVERRGPFLTGLVRRLAWRWKRGEERRRLRERAAARREALPSAEELALRLEMQEMLLAALRRLREPLRSTVLLRYSDDLSSAEIARRQGIPAATVRARLARGIAELRAELDRRTGGERDWRVAFAPWIAARKATVAAVLAGGMVMKGIAVTALALAAVAFLVSRSSERELAGVGIESEAEPGPLAIDAAEGSDAGPAAREALLDGDASPQRELLADESETERAPRTNVELRVLDLARRPIAGASVKNYLRPPVGGWQLSSTVATDAEGRARFEADSFRHEQDRARIYVYLDVEARGFARQPLFREIGADGTTFVGDVLLEPAADLAGLVVDSNGVPVAEAKVEAVVPYDALADGECRDRKSVQLKEHTRSAADGRFVLSGVSLGDTIVRARAPLRPWTLSAPLALRQGERIDELVLTLADEQPERWIHGRVVDTRGAPVARGELLYGDAEKKIDFFFSRRAHVGADGRFELGPLEPNSQRVRRPASDGFALAEVVAEPGTLDLVLRLEDARWLAVRALDEAGAPIAGARVELTAVTDPKVTPAYDRDTLFRPFEGETAADGSLRVQLPPAAFEIEARSAGHRSARAGPFDSDQVASEVVLQLERGPAIRGRVLAPGAPVAGATVELRRLVRGGQVLLPSDWSGSGEPFALRSRDASAFARTDAAGSFTLPIEPVSAARKSDRWLVRAEHPSLASSLAGPLKIDAEKGADELALHLTNGGAVAGEVVLAAGIEAAGSKVCIADEHGETHTLTLGPQASFSFDRLHAGAWSASWFPAGVLFYLDARVAAARAPRSPDFVIVEGETVRCVVDARTCAPALLEGWLVLHGDERGAWTAQILRIEAWQRDLFALLPDGMPRLFEHEEPRITYRDEESGTLFSSTIPSVSSALDPDGRFMAALDRPGEHWLVLANDDGRFPGLALVDRLDLEAGRNAWEGELAFATIQGVRGLVDPDPRTARTLFHRVLGPGQRTVEVSIPCERDGRFGPVRVAAGAGAIYPARWDERLGAVADLAAPLLQLELMAGDARELDVR